MLRDADGVVVKARVAPSMVGLSDEIYMPLPGQPATPPCVHVEYLDQIYVDLPFELETGRVGRCVAEYDAGLSGKYYGSANCSGTPFSHVMDGPTIFALDGQVIRCADLGQRVVTLEYNSRREGDTCVVHSGTVRARPCVSAPMTDALSNPPYTLEIAY